MARTDEFPRFRVIGDPAQQRLVRAADEDVPAAALEATLYRALRTEIGAGAEQAEQSPRSNQPWQPVQNAPAREDRHGKLRRHAARVNLPRTYAAVALLAATAGALLYVQGRRSALPPIEVSREPAYAPPSAAAPAPAPHLTPSIAAPCSNPIKASGTAALIDNLEDRNSRLLPNEGRTGYWYAFNDGTGKNQPLPGPMSPSELRPARAGSGMALHAVGDRLSDWGANVGFTFGDKTCYDASNYAGLEFWARGVGSIQVVVKMIHTVPKEEGGDCEHNCYDAHAKLLALTHDFKKYTVPWSDLKQRGYGDALVFDPAALVAIDFAVAAADTPYDFWIDDVAFVKKRPASHAPEVGPASIPRMVPEVRAH